MLSEDEREALAKAEAERDSAQEHLAYHLRDFRPGADMEATGDLAVDMAAYAGRLKTRLAAVEALVASIGHPSDHEGTWCIRCAFDAALHPDPSDPA